MNMERHALSWDVPAGVPRGNRGGSGLTAKHGFEESRAPEVDERSEFKTVGGYERY